MVTLQIHLALTEWLITGGFTIICVLLWFSIKHYLSRTDKTHQESAEAVSKLTEQTILLAERVAQIQNHCALQENENWRRLNSHSESIKTLTKEGTEHGEKIKDHTRRIVILENKK